MQVCGLPGHVIRNAGAASRLLGAKTPNIEAERRREAGARWRHSVGSSAHLVILSSAVAWV